VASTAHNSFPFLAQVAASLRALLEQKESALSAALARAKQASTGQVRTGLYKIFVHCNAFVNEPIIIYPPPQL